MCQFEDYPVISKYTRQQAVDDGMLVPVLSWNGVPVMATAAVSDNYGFSELLTIWHKFLAWKDMEEPKLPLEERLFSIKKDDKKIWVIEDAEAFTIMYPHEY
jgi:acetone carboxylase gamma subunit